MMMYPVDITMSFLFCCSGYQGCERNCLMHVAEFLGAK